MKSKVNPSLTPFSGRRTACGSTQKGVARLEDEATTVGIPKGRRQIELKCRCNLGGRCKTLGHAPPRCRRPSKHVRDGSNLRRNFLDLCAPAWFVPCPVSEAGHRRFRARRQMRALFYGLTDPRADAHSARCPRRDTVPMRGVCEGKSPNGRYVKNFHKVMVQRGTIRFPIDPAASGLFLACSPKRGTVDFLPAARYWPCLRD